MKEITAEWLDSKLKEVENIQDKVEELLFNKNLLIRFFNRAFKLNKIDKLNRLAEKKLNDIISGKILEELIEHD